MIVEILPGDGPVKMSGTLHCIEEGGERWLLLREGHGALELIDLPQEFRSDGQEVEVTVRGEDNLQRMPPVAPCVIVVNASFVA